MGPVTLGKPIGVSPREIAKWFVLQTDHDAGNATTHLKVQKLVYYAQGWSMAKLGAPLFDEDLEAWAHGPVARSVWEEYKSYGFDPLPRRRLARRLDGDVTRLLVAVDDKYSEYSAKGLERKTHNERPWLEARGNLPPEANCENIISKETMKAFFKSLG